MSIFTPFAYRTTKSTGIVTTNLVMNLDAGNTASYPGTGTTWTDLTGRGNNGTLTNGPTFDSGNGGSISFDATNDFVEVASSSDFGFGTGDFTLEMWINATSLSNYVHMFALPSQPTFVLKADVTTGKIYFYTNTSPTYNTYDLTPGWTLTTNSWYHVVWVRRSSVGYPYLNGTAYASKSGFTNNFSQDTLNIHKGFGTEFTTCKIAIARIYKGTGLTTSEVQQNFNVDRARFGV